ncbi:hypothetical protein JOM56_015664, partial [Amanita muscaria]
MKLKTFLGPENKKPRWTLVADDLIRRNIPTHYNLKDESSKIHPLLQDWRPYQNNTKVNTLPLSIRRMLKATKTYNVTFDPINPSQNLAMQMPIWRHPGQMQNVETRSQLNGKLEKCLRTTHQATTVEDFLHLTSRLQLPNHGVRKNCACPYCKADRRNGCVHPHKCTKKANAYLNSLLPKWDPRQIPAGTLPHPISTQIPSEISPFHKNIAPANDISEGFRVFWQKDKRCDATYRDLVPTPPGSLPALEQRTKVFTDGSCISNGSADSRASSGIWFGPSDPRNSSVRLPPNLSTNNAGELVAILNAASQTRTTDTLHILSD